LADPPAGFGPIIERYKDAVFGVSLARLRNFHDAEDVSQQVFIEAFERLSDLNDPDKLDARAISGSDRRNPEDAGSQVVI
jgi:DNA-directed RNA polymerase specialized sigma24 family protein